MIKQLIEDLAFDNISLSKSLTRAKIIANKIDSSEFTSWLKKELEGYGYNDEQLPDYRKIGCTCNLVAELPFNRFHTFPVSYESKGNKLTFDELKYHFVLEPIAIIEQNMERLTTPIGEIPLSIEQVAILGKPFERQISEYNGVIRRGYKQVSKAQYENIIELTKQKLLDTLLELDKQFPNLENEFSKTKDNIEKVLNIITNNVYGDNSPINLAAGQQVVQKDINVTYSLEEYQQLRDLGVEENKIEELKTIVETESNNKTILKEKTLKWLGSVTASVAAKGLYDNIPTITEFISRIV